MNLIVAVDKGFGIGKDNGLLARIPADMEYFKEKTMGKTIVMGSSTYMSFPKRPLPNRENLVLTSKPENYPEVKCFTSTGELFEFIRGRDDDVFVCGGSTVYLQLLPYCEKAYVTHIDETFDADAFFPNLSELDNWEKTEESKVVESNGYRITFAVYENNDVKSVQDI
ncbi:MAG: dihydrofolate reductase [Ruminiclostridium sp.]|nr:dihydrofolate reductase [Ruminiclostridium sp.]MBQ8841996.1 dihydrofolate reductase [Ruminiclostridium sp.]